MLAAIRVRSSALCLLVFVVVVAGLKASTVAENEDSIRRGFFTKAHWIWAPDVGARQTCRFWQSFVVPSDKEVVSALLRVTGVDNHLVWIDYAYCLGRGGGNYNLTEYDVSLILEPGRHSVCIKAYNRFDKVGGVILELSIFFSDGSSTVIGTDDQWYHVPEGPIGDSSSWIRNTRPESDWGPVVIVDALHAGFEPQGVLVMPTQEPHPPLPFWQHPMFAWVLVSISALAMIATVWSVIRLVFHSNLNNLLKRERERIARDLHDGFGAQLTQLILQSEVSQIGLPPDSDCHGDFERLSDRARGLRGILDELVWAVNSRRDTVRDTVSYIGKYAQSFFEGTPIRCRLDVPVTIRTVPMDLMTRRNLLFLVKEALSNVVRHSNASEVIFRVGVGVDRLRVSITDNGNGLPLQNRTIERNGLTNMKARVQEIGGRLGLSNAPEGGCRVEIMVPLTHRARWQSRFWWKSVTPPSNIRAWGPTRETAEASAK